MKKITLLFCAFFFVQFLSAQIVNIPDANLKTALLNHSSLIDSNFDGEIQISEAQALTGVLNLTYKQISNVSGIENFTNITELNLDNNELTSFPVITSLINVETLNLTFNQLSSIDLSGFTAVENLNIGYNNLNAISDSELPNSVLILSIRGNNLTTFTSQLPNLVEIRLDNNSLNSINLSALDQIIDLNLSTNDFITLSNSNLPAGLTSLNLTSNSIASISSSDIPPNLTNLDLSLNHVTSLNLQSSSNLDTLNLGANNLNSFNVSGCPANLTALYIYNNNLSNLDISSLAMLENLSVSANQLTNIDLSGNSNLKVLNTSYNPLTSLDVSNNPELQNILLMDMEDLTYLNLKNGNNENMSSSEPFYQMPNVEYVCVDDVDTFFENLYVEEWQGEPWFTVSTNCEFAENQLNTITGVVKYDIGSGCEDASAVSMANTLVSTQVGADEYGTITNVDGEYTLYTDEGENIVSAVSISTIFDISPASHAIDFDGYNNQETANFCAESNQVINDVNIVFLPLESAVPGFYTYYEIAYENTGTTTLNGEVILTYDESLQSFVSATPSQTSSSQNTLSFSFSNLLPFETEFVDVKFLNETPPTLNGGDVLQFTLEIVTTQEDENQDDNTYMLSQNVVDSYDPNDKLVTEGHQILLEDADKYLHYMVRFQNTGSANAQKVVVTDTLSENLDWSSLQMVSASDDYYLNIVNGNALEFVLNDIDLPYEDLDEEGSKGYIAYKVKPKEGIQLGEIMQGNAAIYFDYNEPIITNTVSTEIVENLSVATAEFSQDIQLYPNPTSRIVNLFVTKGIDISKVEVYDITGKRLSIQKDTKTINLENFSEGIYFVIIMDAKGAKTTKKLIKK